MVMGGELVWEEVVESKETTWKFQLVCLWPMMTNHFPPAKIELGRIRRIVCCYIDFTLFTCKFFFLNSSNLLITNYKFRFESTKYTTGRWMGGGNGLKRRVLRRLSLR